MVKSLSLMVHRRTDALLYNRLRPALPPRDQPDRAAPGLDRTAGDNEPNRDVSGGVCYFRLWRV
jgi:hypothetical protein